jgi:hypothetical protein
MLTDSRRLSGVVLGSVLQTGNSLEFPPDPALTHTSRLADAVHVFLKTSTEREFENTLWYRELWFSRIIELDGQRLPLKLPAGKVSLYKGDPVRPPLQLALIHTDWYVVKPDSSVGRKLLHAVITRNESTADTPRQRRPEVIDILLLLIL